MPEIQTEEKSFEEKLDAFINGETPIISCDNWDDTLIVLNKFGAKLQAADGFEKANNQTVLCRPTSLNYINLEEITDLDTDTKSWRVYNTRNFNNDN